MTFIPREPQRLGIEAVLAHWASDSPLGALLCLPTGVGKTATACSMAVDVLERGGRVVWVAHRTELITQPMETLRKWWNKWVSVAGIVQGKKNQAHARIVFASRDTIKNPIRAAQVLEAGYPDLLVIDEAHHSVSDGYLKVIAVLRGENTKLLGLTATPDREDGKDLGQLWRIAYSYTMVDAIVAGILAPPYAAVDKLPGLDLAKISGGADYKSDELAAHLLENHVVPHTVAALSKTYAATRLPYRDDTRLAKQATGRGILLFTVTVAQAMATAAALCEAGVRARYLHGATPKGERKRLLQLFRDRKIDALCNAGVLTEGTDLPRTSCIVIARPTKSWSLYVQMVGRGVRTGGNDQEECLIIDLVGATDDHSLLGAAVLISGDGCEEHTDGRHRYLGLVDGSGICECGEEVACIRHKGPHKYLHGRCKCGQRQCEALDGPHHWVPLDMEKRYCVGCQMEITAPGLWSSKRRKKVEKEPVAWARLALPGEVWGCSMDIGVLASFKVGELWRAVWIQGRTAMPLTNKPVSEEELRLLTDDVARKARRVAGKYGGWDGNEGKKRAKVIDCKLAVLQSGADKWME